MNLWLRAIKVILCALWGRRLAPSLRSWDQWLPMHSACAPI